MLLSPVKAVLRRQRFKVHIRARPLKLVVGSSGAHDAGWVPSEAEYLNLLNATQWRRYFAEGSIDAILAEHVWEHLTADEAVEAARRCFQYLRPGGYLRVAVPDGFHPSRDYIEYVRPGGGGPGADDHKVLYTHVTFGELFEKVGYNVRRLEYFNADGEFQEINWAPEDGKIKRSRRFDPRNGDGVLKYTSIILDAHKPMRVTI